ncbi:uridine diphosphate-N-acetylglucosamine-binding protein YvcK [uncultured Corynebacterium sp.]|uniref:gluconeogenesis factor YvcK family protein n=1 Tax=uncultured Corynebacterium sp. TaxID=159447 RepID=UPI0025E1A537|nr:uridine diphosphate-N-acetylglucosamine-binding protein YvcK [uncultured Corynebacterium sp.]
MSAAAGERTLDRIASLGGGHGLFATLRAARGVADYVTAVVTVADDGGSSGRMRRELGSLPPGDLRMALAALVRDTPRGHLWEHTLQHRFGGHGALAGHAVGNLILGGLTEVMGSSIAALDELGELLGIRGRVVPMSPEPLDLEAEVQGLGDDPREVTAVRGQVAVASTLGTVRRVRLIPQDAPATDEAVQAILDADLVTLGPGSWFSSVIPHLLIPGIVDALARTTATRVVLMNLVAESSETNGFSMERHIHMLLQHSPSLRVDVVVVDRNSVQSSKERRHLERAAERLGARVLYRDVREDDDRGRFTDRHSPSKLADVLREFGGTGTTAAAGATTAEALSGTPSTTTPGEMR